MGVRGHVPPPAEATPAWLGLADDGQRIDVRPMLGRGEDPLAEVLRVAAGVPHGGFLTVEAPFNPVPMRRVLAARGFSSYAERLSAHRWLIRFHNDGQGSGVDEGGAERCGGDETPHWWDGQEVHIDVRGLPPPVPLLAILRLVSGLDGTTPVIVHHDRDPIYLYPELAEIGWQAETVAGAPGEVRLRLTRAAS